MKDSTKRPHLLRADNFTPPTRTPWGGRKILGRYKSGLALSVDEPVVGEAWEVSVEPDFPSRFQETDQTLADAIAEAPEAWLGEAVAARHGGQTPLLVKLLDSADNLSVQVHPVDGDPSLAADESGKPESWLVLEADAGAGLYLGFRDGVRREDVERCIERQEALDRLLNFVPVLPGDVFVIQAGSAHAIGRGVTLVEPQFVAPGRRGVTYRYWDWNRRYDEHGTLDPAGQPRALHLARSLEVTDWAGPRGDAFVAACRPERRVLTGGPVARRLLVDWEWFVVEEWAGSGALHVAAPGTMLAITCVGGSAAVATAGGAVDVRRGQSCVVPAAAGDLELQAEAGRLIATRSVS
ncbi:MAG: type I phosphomannose isomerase catalytic subunit [bacterium]